MRAFKWFSKHAMWFALLAALSGSVSADSADTKRANVRKQSQEVLARLYDTVPAARKEIAQAPGYATFHKLGLKVGVAGAGRGRGLAVDKSGKETFLKYLEVTAGVGMGIKSFDLIFVFETEQALADFINNGWEYSGQATAAAKHGDSGTEYSEAQSVSPGVRLYQVTSSGLSAEITIKGTKYFKDKALNEP